MDPAGSESRRPFVLDTSVFVNPEVRRFFGPSPDDALEAFLERAVALGIECYMPPSAYRELAGFLDTESLTRRAWPGRILQKSPTLEVKLPARLLGDWIGEIRGRIDRGLRIAEKAVRAAERGESLQTVVRRLRTEYRRALREGTVDSVEDLDLALLALEVEGILLSADAGLRMFAAEMGVRLLDPEQAASLLGMSPPDLEP